MMRALGGRVIALGDYEGQPVEATAEGSYLYRLDRTGTNDIMINWTSYGRCPPEMAAVHVSATQLLVELARRARTEEHPFTEDKDPRLGAQ